MITLKKNIVLSNKTGAFANSMAVLTLDAIKTGVYGTLKTYNIKEDNNLLLGIAVNGEPVLKQNISLSSNSTYNFKLNGNFDLNKNIGCVLVYDEPEEVVPIVWGTAKPDAAYKQAVIQNLNSLKYKKQNTLKESLTVLQTLKTESAETIQEEKPEDLQSFKKEFNYITEEKKEEPKDLAELFNLPSDDELDNIIEESLLEQGMLEDSQIAATAKPQEAMPEQPSQAEPSELFFDAIKDQVEDLFSKYPSEVNLENLVPNSKWVKVDFEGSGNPYVLGLIYSDIELKYICYGVPGDFDKNPPAELAPYSQWLPRDAKEVEKGGYWVMYQDALTGESIEINAV